VRISDTLPFFMVLFITDRLPHIADPALMPHWIHGTVWSVNRRGGPCQIDRERGDARSALDAGKGDALDEMALRGEEEGDDGYSHQHGRGHHEAVVAALEDLEGEESKAEGV